MLLTPNYIIGCKGRNYGGEGKYLYIGIICTDPRIIRVPFNFFEKGYVLCTVVVRNHDFFM